MDKPKSKQRTNYHHGDLRLSLVKAAGELIQEQDVEALSMRKLADHVGVSRTAPYHHFKDKNELLCAIAESGFKLQDEIVSSANRSNLGRANAKMSTSDGLQELEQLVQSYIQSCGPHAGLPRLSQQSSTRQPF